MNVILNNETKRPSSPNPSAPFANVTSIRHVHRERDFGVGYGSSSGYAAPRRYVTNGPQPLFRCA